MPMTQDQYMQYMRQGTPQAPMGGGSVADQIRAAGQQGMGAYQQGAGGFSGGASQFGSAGGYGVSGRGMSYTPQGMGARTGMVGSPNLGMDSSLQRWAGQVPGGYQYLQRIGMMPQETGMTTQSGQGPMGGPDYAGEGVTLGGHFYQGLDPQAAYQGAYSPDFLAARRMQEQVMRGGGGASQQQQYARPDVAAYAASHQGYSLPMGGQGGYGGGVSSGGGWSGGQPQQQGITPQYQSYSGREVSPMEAQMQGAVGGMLQNPTGYTDQQKQMLRNQASQPYAGQQQQNAEDIRADAIRRGASTSDADIRDQLNRSNMAGAQSQQQAGFDVDRALADLQRTGTLGALGAGNQMMGSQLGDVRSLREMQVLMAQLQAQQGPISGLGMAL